MTDHYWNEEEIRRVLEEIGKNLGTNGPLAIQAPRAYKPGENPAEPYKQGDLAIVIENGRTFWHRVTDSTEIVPPYPGLGWTEYVGGLSLNG